MSEEPRPELSTGAPEETRDVEPGRRLDLALRWALLTALGVWLAVSLPLALGWKTLYFRDVFNHFLPFKSFGVHELLVGRIPAINPTDGLGQPYRGDPGNLAYYPGTLLFLVLPLWSALNLHYLLHWLLSFFTFRVLARRLGLGPPAAAFAALAWAGSGWMLSNLTFHNLIVVATWWPLVIAGALEGGRKGVALGGLACGLALLGGEPVTAALGLVPLAGLVLARQVDWRGARAPQDVLRGLLRGVATVVAIGLIGLAVALPQVVATWRVMGFSQRVVLGVSPVTGYSFHPARLLELVIPVPFGGPAGLGVERFWASRIIDRTPFVLSLHLGAVALGLAVVGIRRRPLWALGAGAGLLFAWLGRLAPGAVFALSAGLFRFPEKFFFWFALFAPLLAGAGLERVLETRRAARTMAWLAAALVLAALLLWVSPWAPALGTGAIGWLAPDLPADEVARLAAVWLPRWIAGLTLSAVLLGVAGWAARRRSAAALVALQVVAWVPLVRLIPTDATEPYRRRPPWAEGLVAGTEVLSAPHSDLFRRTPLPYRRPPGATAAVFRRVRHLDLDFPTGVVEGLSYPLGPDAVGFHTPLMTVLGRGIGSLDDTGLARWMRVLGVGRVVRLRRPEGPDWRWLDEQERLGLPTELLAVERPAPAAWWPDELEVAPDLMQALRWVSGIDDAARADPIRRVTVPQTIPHRPGAKIGKVEVAPDRLSAEVDGPGGVLVFRRAYHTVYRARSGGRRLSTFPVDMVLLGVQVPAGHQRVVVDVSAWPEILAGGLAVAVALVALAFALGLASEGRAA